MDPRLKPNRDYPTDQSNEAGSMESPTPMRETFQTRLARVIDRKREELAAMEQLQKIAGLVDPGTPLDELMWSLTQRL